MQAKLAYLSMDVSNIQEFEVDSADLVCGDNVCVDRRVKQGKHWNTKKWRDHIDRMSTEVPKARVHGNIIGYTDEHGKLHGQNTVRQYNQVQQGQAHWCVVRWDNGNMSVYPIGAQGIYALSYVR